jgi:general secretion pathway protein G
MAKYLHILFAGGDSKMFRLKKDSTGFTLIELLIVVAIIGIIAAIAIPNLLNAIQRGKQKRTMSDIRSIGTAVESYQVDNGFPISQTTLGNISTIGAYLMPTYIKILPTQDAWKKDVQYIGGPTLGDTYTVRSYGKDRSDDTNNTQGSTNNFNNDIVYSNGQFTIWPEGTQN